MLFKTAIISAVALVFAGEATAAAVAPPHTLIATDKFFACNCPNNCDYGPGTPCKFYGGPSDSSDIVEAFCQYTGGVPGLQCGG